MLAMPLWPWWRTIPWGPAVSSTTWWPIRSCRSEPSRCLVVARREGPLYAFDDYAGLGTTHPLLAAMMALFMFALAGFPPTAGFAGKFYVFSAAVQAGYYGLALIGVLTSVVSVVYYARVVMLMYMHEPNEAQPLPRLAPTTMAVLGITAIGILYMGIFPGGVMRLAEHSVAFLFQVKM